MRLYLIVFVLAALGSACLAGEIRTGATMQVKANSIWFEEADGLARWQARRKSADAAAFAAYQDNLLREREAWQFLYRYDVIVLGYEPEKNRVHVKMLTTGRLQDSTWFVDAGAIER